MRKLDEQGCKVCGGERTIYSTKIRGSFRIRYFRCIDCKVTSKTMQRLGIGVPDVAVFAVPLVAIERTIEAYESSSQS